MDANELFDALIARGTGREVEARPGTNRTVRVAGLELAIADQAGERHLRARWRERVGTTATSYLLVADRPGMESQLVVLGPSNAHGPIRVLTPEALSTVLEGAAELEALDAVRHVASEIDRLDQQGIPGVRLNRLLTIHTLDSRLRGDATRWSAAQEAVDPTEGLSGWREVLSSMGYELERRTTRGWLARFSGRPIAVIHPKADPSEFARLEADGRPVEGLLMADCRADGAHYGMMVNESRFRLFDAESSTSTASWIDIDASLLSEVHRPLLALMSPPYLAGGELQRLQDEAEIFGTELRKRLDETIRQDALPALASGLGSWAARHGVDVADDAHRARLEEAALTLLFRVLFILYAESAGFLPMHNQTYRQVSLTALVGEASETFKHLSAESSALWSRLNTLVGAMRSGNPAWEVAAYNGALFAETGFKGAELLERLELPDTHFARVLIAVGRDEDTGRGVDYSVLDVAHLGHIYEALLALRLSVARQSLRYDAASDRYIPESDEPDIQEGDLLWQTHEGGRKAGGVYYTRAELVRHIVDRAVLPAFEQHLEEVSTLATKDPAKAALRLLEFSVLDPACGSAHFLVQVLERLADRTVLFLADTPLPALADHIDGLRAGATPGIPIDDVSLLRRLILKHCVFGVDLSPMGAEVATLSLWLKSFVPGLSLAYLGRNVLVGNSLVGVARPDALGPERPPPKKGKFGDFHADDLGQAEAFFQRELESALESAGEAVAELADIHDRTPDEYEASREADERAQRATAGLRRLFDLWTAEGFGQVGARQEVELNGVNVISGDMAEETAKAVEEAARLHDKHSFLHWPLGFPQVFSRSEPGFDVVVGNPPWEEVTVERLSFYGLHEPGIRSFTESEREQAIEKLLERRPDLEERLEVRQEELAGERAALSMGEYEPMRGDPDLYKFFCRRYRALVRPGGLLGVVLPRTAFVNDGSQAFREWLFERNEVSRLDFLVNKGRWAFDSEPRYTVALVVAERSEPGARHQVEVAGTATSLEEWNEQSTNEGLRIARAAFGPGWITPLLRTQAEADLLAKVRTGSRFPFGSKGRWQCFPVAELHETNDKSLWRDATSGRPLWKGESFEQYDPHGAGARLCPTSDAVWEKVRGPRLRPGAGSMLSDQTPLADRRHALAKEVERARLAFRDVSRATDSRTVRACLVPPEVFLTNKAPYLVFMNEDVSTQVACLGILNSLPFDWQARRFVEINLNFFLLEGLIVPDLTDDDYRAVSKAAARLSAVDDRFTDFAREAEMDVGSLSEEERQRLRVEIDARIARAWKMTGDDLDVMFSDFTLEAVPADYRDSVTHRLAELS